jgi:hypothetical protein
VLQIIGDFTVRRKFVLALTSALILCLWIACFIIDQKKEAPLMYTQASCSINPADVMEEASLKAESFLNSFIIDFPADDLDEDEEKARLDDLFNNGITLRSEELRAVSLALTVFKKLIETEKIYRLQDYQMKLFSKKVGIYVLFSLERLETRNNEIGYFVQAPDYNHLNCIESSSSELDFIKDNTKNIIIGNEALRAIGIVLPVFRRLIETEKPHPFEFYKMMFVHRKKEVYILFGPDEDGSVGAGTEFFIPAPDFDRIGKAIRWWE